jgi:hypothetical protein
VRRKELDDREAVTTEKARARGQVPDLADAPIPLGSKREEREGDAGDRHDEKA